MNLQERSLAKINMLTQLMAADGLDGMIITHPLDQYYLCGAFILPKEAIYLVHPKGVTCITRKLYIDTLLKTHPFMEYVGQDHERAQKMAEVIAEKGLKHVGFDAQQEDYYNGKFFKEQGYVEAKSYIRQLRFVKDEYDIEIIRESCRIAYNAYEQVLPLFKEGVTELEMCAALEHSMRLQGASHPSFQTMVAFGDGTGDVHHESTNRKLKFNEAIMIDFGCVYKGYCSDMTRSWWYGDKEPEEYKKIWSLVNTAWKAGIAAEKPGISGRDVDSVARKIITDAGYGEYFNHRLGHGVGMEIHEEPCNDQNNPNPLQKGNVITVEPGIYLPGKFGVRLEETTVITDTGAEILTRK